jgi:hypothetical protein
VCGAVGAASVEIVLIQSKISMNRLGVISLLFCLILLSASAAAQVYPLSLEYKDGKIKASIASNNSGRFFFLETVLPQTKMTANPEVVWSDSNRIITTQTIRYFEHVCTVINTVTKQPFGLQWDIEIRGNGNPWTVPVETVLQWDRNDSIQFWTSWPNNQVKPYEAEWQDPFETSPLRDLSLVYGGESHWSANAFALPIATSFIPGSNFGLSFIQSLQDTILGLEMHTSSSGKVSYRHINHRINNENAVHIRHSIVLHEADWRAGMQWMVKNNKTHFLPKVPAASSIAGGGAYSSYEGEIDTTRYKNMAFSINWKASLDFPYMGMFIPPVKSDTQTWVRYKQRGETIGDGLASIKRLSSYSEHFKKMGFNTLSYFNVTEFGNTIVYPYKRKEQSADNFWKDANDFLYNKLFTGILRPPSIKPDWDERPIFSNWENCVAMDPGDSTYQSFLLDQAKRHLEKIPASSGICIDRMDWLRYYNGNADDKVSFVQQNKTRSLVLSWKELMAKLGPLMHHSNKVIFCNPLYRRIDLMNEIDGFYDEYGNYPNSLNLCAQMAMFKPTIAWTTSKADFKPDPDAYFQHHLYMGAFLTVPFPGNDHTINPDSSIEKFYLDYGPMFNAIKGRQWILTPNVISVKEGKAKANAFLVNNKVLIPIVHGKEDVVKFTVRLPYDLLHKEKIQLKLLYPGMKEWKKLAVKKYTEEIELEIPLLKGCALLSME